jgi:hypothetical protein
VSDVCSASVIQLDNTVRGEALGRHLVHILLLISIISIFGDLVYINNLPPNSYNMCQDMQSCPLITVKFTKRLSKFFQEEILAAIVVR